MSDHHPPASLNIIGCGRLGKTLARLWHDNNLFTVRQVLNRSIGSAEAAVEFIGAGSAVKNYANLSHADAWLIAFSLFQIAEGVKGKDEAKLQNKIAWQSVRASLREPVTKMVKKEIDNQAKGRGVEGLVLGELAGKYSPQVVEKILDAYVTPKGIIMLAEQGGKLKTADLGIDGLVQSLNSQNIGVNNGSDGELLGDLIKRAKEAAGKIPGGKELVGNALGKYGKEIFKDVENKSADKSGSKLTSYGLNNIKSISFNGPLNFEVALSKSPTARKPDVIAGMSFVDMDWKLSKIVPAF